MTVGNTVPGDLPGRNKETGAENDRVPFTTTLTRIAVFNTAAPITVGAVYRPLAVIVPVAGAPWGTPLTNQTGVPLPAPRVNCTVWPGKTTASEGVITGGLLETGAESLTPSAELLTALLPALQPAMKIIGGSRKLNIKDRLLIPTILVSNLFIGLTLLSANR